MNGEALASKLISEISIVSDLLVPISSEQMASSSILVIQSRADSLRFVRIEEYAASFLPVGETHDSRGEIEAKVCLFFFKPETVGQEVPFDYLLTAQLYAFFCPGFSNAHNWKEGKDIYYFSITYKRVK